MEKTKEEKRGQFQRLEGEIAEESKRLAIAIGGRGNLFSGRQFVYRTGRIVQWRHYGFCPDCTNDFGQLSASADSEF